MTTRKKGSRAQAKLDLATAIDKVFPLVLDLPQRKPGRSLPRRLDALFHELASLVPARNPDDVEDLIWALWISHETADAAADMAAGIEAMTAGALDLAEAVFDRLTNDHPDWAEAWNKRATLAFIAKQDVRAIADIATTLQIEPRHFGAIAGFGQICLRNERPREAMAAFQMALSINPHLQGVSEVIGEIAVVEGPLH